MAQDKFDRAYKRFEETKIKNFFHSSNLEKTNPGSTDADFVRYQTLTEQIKNHNSLYYAGLEGISDAEYDGLYLEMKELEKRLGLSEEQSQSQVVGHVIGSLLDEHIHLRPMLSLQTEVDSSEKGFVAFDARIRRELMVPVGSPIEYISEVKFDGLGLNLQYVKGILARILTRGNGEVGENVTHALPMFEGSIIPDISAKYPYDIEIRGEGMMTLEDFRTLNRQLETLGQKPMANPRNAAAGSVRTFDLEKIKTRKMLFFPYSIGDCKGPSLGKTHGEHMKALFKLGFTLLGEGGHVSQTLGSPTDLAPYEFFKKTGADRANLGIEIDGIVHKVNSIALQEKLGFRSREPRWAVAQKFPPEIAETTLYAIDVQVGRTGQITPVGKILPVRVGGVMVAKATLHNVFDLRRRGVRVGDIITIQRAGDVIPEIAYRMDRTPRPMYIPNFHPPKYCPSCGSLIVRPRGEKNYYCSGKEVCKEQVIGALLHFVSRDATDIQGLGEVTITELVNKGQLNNYLDIYVLSEDQYASEVGTLLAKKIMVEIERSKKTYAWKVLYGLGIKEVGSTYSKLYCAQQNLATLVQQRDVEVLAQAAGMGPSAAGHLKRYFLNVVNQARLAMFQALPGINLKYLINSSQAKGMLVLFTGSFPGYTREQLKNLVESQGGKTTSSVTSKTTHVVTGENATTHKVDKARNLLIPVLTLSDFETYLKGLT